jgi:hypothetical protein
MTPLLRTFENLRSHSKSKSKKISTVHLVQIKIFFKDTTSRMQTESNNKRMHIKKTPYSQTKYIVAK